MAVAPELAPRPDPVRPLRPRLRRPAHEPAPVVVPPRTDAPATRRRLDDRCWTVPAGLLPAMVDSVRPGDPVAPACETGPAGMDRSGPEPRHGDALRPDGATWPNGAASRAGLLLPGDPVRLGDPVQPGDLLRRHASVESGRSGRAASVDAELSRLAADLVRRMVEVLAGRRAPGQLAGVAEPRVVRYLTVSRDSGRGTRLAAPPRRIHVSQPTPDAAEITAVCPFGPRSRALTLRLDRDPRRRWHVSAVRLL